jgi:hypothetical protein
VYLNDDCASVFTSSVVSKQHYHRHKTHKCWILELMPNCEILIMKQCTYYMQFAWTLSHTIFYYAKFSFGKRGPSQSILGNLFETIKSCESCYFPQNKLFMLISYKKCIAWKSKVYVKDLYMIIFKQSTYLHSPTVFIIRDMY